MEEEREEVGFYGRSPREEATNAPLPLKEGDIFHEPLEGFKPKEKRKILCHQLIPFTICIF